MIAAVPLTPRCTEAMDLAGDGYSNGEISARMGITIQRVTQLLAVGYAEYGVTNRVDAVLAHERARLIEKVYRQRLKAQPRRKPTPPRIAAGQSDMELA